jgi:FtsP/CotA-like multicopper oxidase with cupredoxin domain
LLKFNNSGAIIMRPFRFYRRKFLWIAISTVLLTVGFYLYNPQPGPSQTIDSVCPRPAIGSLIENPTELISRNGFLKVNLTVLKGIRADRSCYRYNGNLQAPTIRIKPGDTVVWKLTNPARKLVSKPKMVVKCTAAMPAPGAANLHFHGLNISPTCGQDDSIGTVIQPNEQFEYRLKIPKNESPGMYWYHPHIHTQSEDQLLAGLSGAIIVEGIEQINTQVKGLEERVFVIRDAQLSAKFPESDKAQPAKDMSINYVPINYQGQGTYNPPAIIDMTAARNKNKAQFWRVVNASADNYANLQVQFAGVPQTLGLVAMDGVAFDADNENKKNQTIPRKQIALPPGTRAEFVVQPPPAGVKAKLLTLPFATNGDNNPQRTLANIVTNRNTTVKEKLSRRELPTNNAISSRSRFLNMDATKPQRTRTLYFSQKEDEAKNLKEFYLTEQGKKPRVFDMMTALTKPDIKVQHGIVEDWVIQNRSTEAHVFHIHQTHFKVMKSPDRQELGMIRDTINIPAWDEKGPYPKVQLRIDFRNPDIVGNFLYHCHILEHEDNGMMGSIRVT